MTSPMLRVRARGDGRCPHVDELNLSTRRRRAVGRQDDGPGGTLGAPLAAGELVPDNAYYRRRITQRDLEIVEEPATVDPAAPEVTLVEPALEARAFEVTTIAHVIDDATAPGATPAPAEDAAHAAEPPAQ